MAAATTSSAIGEPFQLFLGSVLSRSVRRRDAVSCTYNPDFPGYTTVTAQGDGIHVWDLKNLHPAASYSVSEHVVFAIPAFSLSVTEEGHTSVISYAVLDHTPDLHKSHRGRCIWVIRQSLSGSGLAASHKTAVLVDHQPARICGTGHAAVPLLLVSKNASLALANAQLGVKSRLDWPGERNHVETFVFAREARSFVQDDRKSDSRIAVTCCQAGLVLHVRLVLLGEEIVPVATCEIPIASSASDTDTMILGLTCSPSGILTVVYSRGTWATYQLASLNSSLVFTPVSENLHLRRFCALSTKKPSKMGGLSVVSLGTSLVLLVGLLNDSQLSLQIWDLSFGVLLTTQLMPAPPAFPGARIRLTVADEGHVLLTASPYTADSRRSSIHVVPLDARLKSSLASALGKMALTAEWLALDALDDKEPVKDPEIFSVVQKSLKENNAQQAEQAFLNWVKSNSSKSAILGYEFVKKMLSVVLPALPDKSKPKEKSKQSTNYPYTPRITRCLLENAVVSTVMLNGRLITALRERGDWENVMFALTTVADVTEDELMASAKFLIDRQRRNENAMEVDASEGYIPPLWTYLFACVSYPFSSAPMRLAIRKHLPDAQDLVLVLEILENWIQGGTEQEIEVLLKSVATNTGTASGGADCPPYPKVITFLQALMDASFVALLQYQPSYDLLRRILSYIEPEIALIDSLEPLRMMLEPFTKAQVLKEKMDTTSKESQEEWRRRRKQLEQRDSLSVGLYRLEELVI